MPPNLVTLFAHVMSRAIEGGNRGSAAHGWEDVLNATSAQSSSPSPSSSASSSSSGTISPGPCCPMSAQDWRKAEAFSVHLQSLLAARQTLCKSNSNGNTRASRDAGASSTSAAAVAASALHSNGGGISSSYHGGGPPSAVEGRSSATPGPINGQDTTSYLNAKHSTPHTNGRMKGGRAKPLASSGSAATPNPAPAWPRQHAPRVTPKEPSRAGGGEPSAPIKVAGRVAVSRRVNGGAEGAVASLAVSRAGPGAFETPAHATSHHHHLHHQHPSRAAAAGELLPGTDNDNGHNHNGNGHRGREHSPSRYPARLRSRRFPQLGGSGDSPDPQLRGLGHHQHHHHHHHGTTGAGGLDDDDDQSQGGRRLSPRHSPPSMLLLREHGRGLSSEDRHHHSHDWLVAAAGAAEKGEEAGRGGVGSGRGAGAGVFTQVNHDRNAHAQGGHASESFGMRTRGAPKSSQQLPDSVPAMTSRGPSSSSSSPSPLAGASTPQMSSTGAVVSPVPMDFRPAPPPIMSAAAAAAAVAAVAAGGSSSGGSGRPTPRVEVAAPRPRQVLQGGGRSGGRAAPLPRSSVGGRNYTDNHVKQLGMIEAAVVANATARDRATYNLPRQGRTLTLTNIFKFIALRGAGTMYRLAMDKQVEAHTGRHSNFFDGKIDARIVGVIKKDIGDEAITKSRKFSKILLSLIAEGNAF